MKSIIRTRSEAVSIIDGSGKRDQFFKVYGRTPEDYFAEYSDKEPAIWQWVIDDLGINNQSKGQGMNKMVLDPATMAAVVSEIKKLRLSIEPESLAMAEEDPLIRATKKAYRGSKTYQLDKLLEARSRWSRKVTIASNKLADVNAAIVGLCKELAGDADKKGSQHETKANQTPSA